MNLRMIRYGMLAGFGFLLAVAALEWLADFSDAAHTGAAMGPDVDVSAQIWLVLAEARKILEESI